VKLSFSSVDVPFFPRPPNKWDVDWEDDRVRCNAGLVGPGFVPDLIRGSGVGAALFVTTGSSSALVLNCAADTDGRKSFRGVDDPLGIDVNDVISSPFAEGPAEEKDDDPFCDLLSVSELPDRLRFMYFCIASASRSRTRFAIGDRE
jgi:hypothetical protein